MNLKAFSDFLIEGRDDGVERVHDLALGRGNDGVAQAGRVLDSVHSKLLGKSSGAVIDTVHGGTVHRLVPNPSHYTIGEQKRFLNHMEEAKRSYSKMDPNGMDVVGRVGYQLKHYLTNRTPSTDPHKTEGFLDYLTKQHDKRTDRNDQSQDAAKKRESYSEALKHATSHRKHLDGAMEVHHHLARAQDVLAGVINKTFRMDGKSIGRDGAVVSGHMGRARIQRRG